eukprot:TRINITY_DN33988_c0_g1_i1.p4 TRINITY_DN33988_c0_g1~~TRINITY_DN33988_c0_g1_i1.p4  ORF type:complete len:129 (+),score=14.51 TRINITY_DN33988_c0_g1_i1:217-603(+)
MRPPLDPRPESLIELGREVIACSFAFERTGQECGMLECGLRHAEAREAGRWVRCCAAGPPECCAGVWPRRDRPARRGAAQGGSRAAAAPAVLRGEERARATVDLAAQAAATRPQQRAVVALSTDLVML